MFIIPGVFGCSQKYPSGKKALSPGYTSFDPYSNILESSYNIADKLREDLSKRGISRDVQILSASFVNIDNLEESCTLGRLISEQLSTRLAQYGYKLMEMKLRRESVFIKEGKGEFLLSRELKNISAEHDAAAVLVGTYAVADSFVFISTRIVSTKDNTVITGCDYQLVLDFVTESLLE